MQYNSVDNFEEELNKQKLKTDLLIIYIFLVWKIYYKTNSFWPR